MKIGIYAGSFDPITNGHLDIITRARNLVDELHILVTKNIHKKAAFTLEERVEMIKKVVKDDKIIVACTDDLVVRYAMKNNASIIFRGLRNVIDFESEILLFHQNKLLNPDFETVVLFPSHGLSYVSSSFVKELVHYNTDISKYVPKELVEIIEKGLKNSFNKS